LVHRYQLLSMANVQLNCRIPEALAAKVRAEAERRQKPVGVLVSEALDALLSTDSKPIAGDSGIDERLADLEGRVRSLEAGITRKNEQQPTKGEAQVPEMVSGAITTSELAAATGTNRAGWVNWAQGKDQGAVRAHRTAGRWRLMGKAATDAGGPARLIWEKA
jgi:hypothetical protein